MKVIYLLQDPVKHETVKFPSTRDFIRSPEGRIFRSLYSGGRQERESKLTLEVPSLSLVISVELKEGENEEESCKKYQLK